MGKLNKLTFVLFGVVGILLVAVIVVGIIKIGGKNKDPEPSKPSQTQESKTDEEHTKAPEKTEPSSTEEQTTTEGEPVAKTDLINEDFEGETFALTGRVGGGAGEILEFFEGGFDGAGHCLKISNRTDNWNGATWSSAGALVGGDKFFASVDATFHDEANEETGHRAISSDFMKLSVQYSLNGSPVYTQIESLETMNNTWVHLEGWFELPEGATDVSVYVESVQTEDLYVDNFRVAIP